MSRGSRAHVVLLAGSLLAACDSPTSPGRLESGLTIVPARTGLIVQTAAPFSARVTHADGRTEAVAAAWSSDAPTVADVDQAGMVRGLRLGVVTVAATYKSFQATRQLRIVPDFSGTWQGVSRFATCTRLSGPGPNVCSIISTPLGGWVPVPTYLTISQVDDALTAATQLSDQMFDESPPKGTLQGAATNIGTFTLSGTLTTVGETDVISDWSASLSSPQQVTGTYALVRNFTNAFGPQVLAITCELSVTKQ